jgi:glycosyltransferase involved in cell wall biosynthesis
MATPLTYFITEELPPRFRWDPINPVRGTEKFYVRTAEEATRLGRTVRVIYDGPETEQNGVLYINRSKHDTSCPDAEEIWLLNPRSSLDVVGAKAQIRIWTNFAFNNPRNYYEWLDSLDTIYDDLVVISPFARTLMPPQMHARVVPHGIDHHFWRHDPNKGDPDRNDPGRLRIVAYTSSPDRGLDMLQRIWHDHKVTETTGYSLVTSNYDEHMSDRKVRELLAKADFWVHPGIGNELFSLSAAEAQAVGCTPIVVPTGALAQTVRHGYHFPREAFERGLLAVLSGEATLPGINGRHIPSWAKATEALLGWDSMFI